MDGEEEEMLDGCGLRLCGPCELSLRETYGGDLDTMATVVDLEPKATEEDEEDPNIRADVGLLRSEGLLMKNVAHEAEAGGGLDDVEMMF